MLALALGLVGLPERVRAPLRGGLAAVLRPGQLLAVGGVDASRTAVAWARAAGGDAGAIARLEQAVEQLRDENRQLKLELAMIGYAGNEEAGQQAAVAESDPLLVPSLVRATVLGEDAVGVLARRAVVSIGTNKGIESDTLVLDAPAPLVDQGRNESVSRHDLVLAGRAVVGRVSNSGAVTSAIQLVTDSQFRAEVQLASASGGLRAGGPVGVLHGTGGPLCRVAQVRVDEPVAPGDRVYSVGGEGLLPHPVLYGEVVRAEPGARFWEISVKPAAELNQLRRVMVLRSDLNPSRMAKGKAGGVVR
jgi:cell shape-determining protein MreC